MMRLESKCLPVGSLPYENEKSTTQMMVRLFENIPFLARLPRESADDNLINITLNGLSCFILKGKNIVIDYDDSTAKHLNDTFNKPNPDNLDSYKFKSAFLDKYFQILERIKPKQTVVNLLGPFTISQMATTADCSQVLEDKNYRKIIIQGICARALWITQKIKEISPQTTPLIIFEEPQLYKLGTLKRTHEDITNDIIVNLYSKIFQKLHQYDAMVGVQCFKKCDWSLIIDAGVDLISFDAYDNPNNLSIIPEKINSFLLSGGYINWGIVPVKTEELIKSLNIEQIYNRFINTIEATINEGVHSNLIYRGSLVSIQGDTDKLPIIFAEKALILSTQLAKRISNLRNLPQQPQ